MGWGSDTRYAFEISDRAPSFAREDRLPDQAEQGPEEPSARVTSEFADPDHLDSAPVLGRDGSELPAARRSVDVGSGHDGLDRPGLRPVVVATLPIDADPDGCALCDIGGALVQIVDLRMWN